MNIDTNLLDLQALALIIASQPLQVRYGLLQLLVENIALWESICRESLPKLNWEQDLERAIAKLSSWRQSGLQATCYFEVGYPSILKTIEDPPLILFSKGRPLSLLSDRCCLAIVGSRRADSEGLELTQQFARELSNFGIVIVSGLALGVDGAAHLGALQTKSEFSTVAVLGSGLDIIYPPQHQALSKQIIDAGGIVVSQFEAGTPPYPSNFLNRNRVVSGLSKAVLVIEATLKSGSLVTARNALEQGKDVLVVPGDISNPRFEGSNRLIQQGATLVTSVQDIVEALGILVIPKSQTKSNSSNGQVLPLASKIEKDIVVHLAQRNEMRVDELVRQLGNVSFEKELLTLELQGIIQRLPGNVLRLKKRS